MRSVFAGLALAALAMASPRPAGVSSSIAPAASAPAGCSENYSGSFEIQVENVTSSGKRSLERRFMRRDTPLTISLSNGVLTDSEGRTGYIASNYQFQFDNPPQAGAIYTAGFSICSNGSLAIGGSAMFYKCLSGTFYNLYEQSSGAQCSPVYIIAAGASSGGSGGSSAPASAPASATSSVAAESSDGQITATPVPSESAQCSEYVDGQPQCSSVVASATAECSEYVDGQPQCSSAVATPSAECSEYVDGQPQCSSVAAPTPSAECSEYVDGQPQCSSAAPAPSAECSEYVDGQPQCSSAAPAPSAECSEYVDGQPQCSSAAMTPAPTGGYATGTASAGYASASYTGPAIQNAAAPTGLPREIFGLAAGVLAVALL